MTVRGSAKRSFTVRCRREMEKIHSLSGIYNGREERSHMQELLRLVSEHAEEIKDLSARGDAHMPLETGDLMVLCYEILLEAGADPDAILEKCYCRYNKKLENLIGPCAGRQGSEREDVMAGQKVTRRKKDIPRLMREQKRQLASKLSVKKRKRK